MRKADFYRWVLVLSGITLGWVAFAWFYPLWTDNPAAEVCLFKGITGVPCPLCGATHAAIFTLQAQWIEAFHYHPLGVLAVFFAVVSPVWTFMDWITQRFDYYRFFQWFMGWRYSRWLLILVVLGVFIFWFWKLGIIDA